MVHQSLIALNEFRQLAADVRVLVNESEWAETDVSPPRNGVCWHEFEASGIILRFKPNQLSSELVAILAGFRVARQIAASPFASLLGTSADTGRAKLTFNRVINKLCMIGLPNESAESVGHWFRVKQLAVATNPDGNTKTVGFLAQDSKVWIELCLGPDGWEQIEFIDLIGFRELYLNQNGVELVIDTLADAANHFMAGCIDLAYKDC